tara:strand:- start:7624 stop:8553 length:930 start_codon:yes stop_codon:yes gene_type:complete
MKKILIGFILSIILIATYSIVGNYFIQNKVEEKSAQYENLDINVGFSYLNPLSGVVLNNVTLKNKSVDKSFSIDKVVLKEFNGFLNSNFIIEGIYIEEKDLPKGFLNKNIRELLFNKDKAVNISFEFNNTLSEENNLNLNLDLSLKNKFDILLNGQLNNFDTEKYNSLPQPSEGTYMLYLTMVNNLLKETLLKDFSLTFLNQGIVNDVLEGSKDNVNRFKDMSTEKIKEEMVSMVDMQIKREPLFIKRKLFNEYKILLENENYAHISISPEDPKPMTDVIVDVLSSQKQPEPNYILFREAYQKQTSQFN